MPYSQHYFPAPKNPSLPVLKELPPGIAEDGRQWIHNLREASGYVAKGDYHFYTYCDHCGGWIRGHANEYEVNTLAPHQLAGRRGTEYYCQRCGEQLAFSGMMS